MNARNILKILFLALVLQSCGNGKDLKKNFSIQTSADKNTVTAGTSVTFSLKAKKPVEIDSVAYYINNSHQGSATSIDQVQIDLKDQKLGSKKIEAKIYTEDETVSIYKELTMVASKGPDLYSFEILNTYPHDPTSYTQGLEFKDGVLYESVGQYGKSALLKVDYKTGTIEKRIELTDEFFAEGLTIINDKIIQLTWKGKKGFIYDLDSFEKQGSFTYGQSKEGWGLCNDGEHIYKSDGTEKIWLLNPDNLAEKTYIQVADNKKLRSKYNELEWVNGKIYANTYQKDGISIINPQSGAVEALVDLRPLKQQVQGGLDKHNEVLNGIALNPETNTLFVTGKHWNKVFEIKIVKK